MFSAYDGAVRISDTFNPKRLRLGAHLRAGAQLAWPLPNPDANLRRNHPKAGARCSACTQECPPRCEGASCKRPHDVVAA
jgi:hypothetical protein